MRKGIIIVIILAATLGVAASAYAHPLDEVSLTQRIFTAGLDEEGANTFWGNARVFTALGFEHILGGADHILFVLSLLLVFISFREILHLTGAFTLAHSLTLILAGTGFLVLSAKIVEPVIALSIAFVAIGTVFFADKKMFKSQKAKLATVFSFGLFHGLGFAGLLQETQVPEDKFLSSLFSFNIGIELGQLFIIALVLPVLFFFRKKETYPHIVKALAIIIAAAGIFWAVERVFFA